MAAAIVNLRLTHQRKFEENPTTATALRDALKAMPASYPGAHREAPRHRYTTAIDALAIGVGILILVAIVADPVIAPAQVIPATNASRVSPFQLMVKSEGLPPETFAAI